MIRVLLSGEATSADRQAITNFLAKNNISCSPATTNQMGELQALAEKRRNARGGMSRLEALRLVSNGSIEASDVEEIKSRNGAEKP